MTGKSLFPLSKWNDICPNGIEKDHLGGVAEPVFFSFFLKCQITLD